MNYKIDIFLDMLSTTLPKPAVPVKVPQYAEYLPDGEMLYLLYALAYSDERGVTKSVVKKRVPTFVRGKAEDVFQILESQQFIKLLRKGRFIVLDAGKKALTFALLTTQYQFNLVRSSRVISTLVACFQNAYFQNWLQMNLAKDDGACSFEFFVEKFKGFYNIIIKQNRRRIGVGITRKREFIEKFQEIGVTPEVFEKHFQKMEAEYIINVEKGRQDLLISWVG
jgi:hypothetical protein